MPKELEKIDEKTKKRESLVIYLLVNYPEKSYERLKNIFENDLIKVDTNKQIINKLNEEYEKGNINIENILDLFVENQETVNYLSGIMSSDFEITDVEKCIDDILVTYRK